MQMNHENMFWSDVTDIKKYTEHTKTNKKNKSTKHAVIMLAAVQYIHIYMQGLKRQNAYDAASILFSDMNWLSVILQQLMMTIIKKSFPKWDIHITVIMAILFQENLVIIIMDYVLEEKITNF